MSFIEPDAFSDDPVPDSVTLFHELDQNWTFGLFCFFFGGWNQNWNLNHSKFSTDVLHQSQESRNIDDATLQNFIYKHIERFGKNCTKE
jgi:hypothetical protein